MNTVIMGIIISFLNQNQIIDLVEFVRDKSNYKIDLWVHFEAGYLMLKPLNTNSSIGFLLLI